MHFELNLSCWSPPFFVILVQLGAKNTSVDGTMTGWVDHTDHPIGIKSAFYGTEQIFYPPSSNRRF